MIIGAVLLVVVGCGSEQKTLSHEEFVAETTKLCSQLTGINVPDNFAELPERDKQQELRRVGLARTELINAYLLLRVREPADQRLLDVLNIGQKKISDAVRRNELRRVRTLSNELNDQLKEVATDDLSCLILG